MCEEDAGLRGVATLQHQGQRPRLHGDVHLHQEDMKSRDLGGGGGGGGEKNINALYMHGISRWLVIYMLCIEEEFDHWLVSLAGGHRHDKA